MATRIVRTRRGKPEDTSGRGLAELLKSIAMADYQIDQLNHQKALATEELYREMKRRKITSFGQAAVANAEIVTPPGRATNVVDPKGFRKLVKDDKTFFSAITVSVTEAKKILPERTLKTITTTIPGKTGQETVKVTVDKGFKPEDEE